jgi:hypothetical protein
MATTATTATTPTTATTVHLHKRRRLTALASALPMEVIRDHKGLSGVDLLAFLVAFNTTNRFIVVEALAGCGKTALLAGLVERLNDGNAVLLLSFTRQAVTVAKLRVQPDAMSAQTFDSLFYHAVKHRAAANDMRNRMRTDEFTYEDFRDLSETITEEDLQGFVCKTDAKYRMDQIKYILVDEAQDTPPQALAILERFRSMGKTVIVTGDRHQAIFGFMRTESLFHLLPADACIVHRLCETRRCCPDVVAYLNARFRLDMVSAYPPTMTCDVIDTICVQTRYNATLGRLYARYLFSFDTHLKVSISEGDSHDKFWDAVYQEAARMYSLPRDKAVAAVKHRQALLETKHKQWHQLPMDWRTPMFVFSTVYHFKGGECDVTVVADDVEVDTEAPDCPETERMRYVAASRARWGIVDMKTLRYTGHEGARRLLHRRLLQCREKAAPGAAAASFGPPPRISAVTENPACMLPLVTSPRLDGWMVGFRRLASHAHGMTRLDSLAAVPRPMLVGSLADVGVGWLLERKARKARVPHIHVQSSEFQARLTRDRQYVHLKRQGLVGEDIDRNLRRLLARMKIRAALSRYLVVLQGWDFLRPLVLRGAHDKTRLQSFMMCYSLSSLLSESVDVCSRVRLAHLFPVQQPPPHDDDDGMPGILASADTWVSLNLQQSMPPNALFFYRGAYDVLVLDRQGQQHLVEVKTVKSVSPSHVLQVLLYTIVVDASLQGMNARWWSYVYEVNRNQMCKLDVSDLLQMLRDDPSLVQELDTILYAKPVSAYYARDLTPATLHRLMHMR